MIGMRTFDCARLHNDFNVPMQDFTHVYVTHTCYALHQTSQIPFQIYRAEVLVCWVPVGPQDIHIKMNQIRKECSPAAW